MLQFRTNQMIIKQKNRIIIGWNIIYKLYILPKYCIDDPFSLVVR